MASIEEKVESLLKEKIENLGYDLYDVEYAKEGKNYFLRIFIDKENGIDLKEQYFLEVSSPGIERVLRKDKHLEQNIGKEVQVKLFKKDEAGKKEYEGKLKSFDETYINLEENIQIERKNIAQIKTIYNW